MTLLERLDEALEAVERQETRLRTEGQFPAADRWSVRASTIREAARELMFIAHHLSRSKLQGAGLSPSRAVGALVEHHNELVSEVALLRRS